MGGTLVSKTDHIPVRNSHSFFHGFPHLLVSQTEGKQAIYCLQAVVKALAYRYSPLGGAKRNCGFNAGGNLQQLLGFEKWF